MDADGDAQDPETQPGLFDRILRRGMTGVIAGLLGLLGLASASILIAQEPWELDARSPVVESIKGECGPFAGAVFTIEIAGRSYRCGGSDSKCPDGPLAVAYDPADPSRCRVAANVDRLSFFESFLILSGASLALFVIAWAAYQRSERLRGADLLAGTTTHERRRARLRTLSAVILIASIVVSLSPIVLALLRSHD